MAKRRGHHEGMIRQRTDGRWEARISLPNGKTKSYYAKTQREARDKLRAAQRELDAGVDLGAGSQTVGQFLARWLDDVIKPAKEPKTYASYEEIVRLHLVPTLGRYPLDKLTPQHVSTLLAAKSAAGLSPRRVSHIRSVLRNALNQAMRWSLVSRNVSSLAAAPRIESHEVQPFNAAEADRILAAAADHRFEALFRLALTLGLREGEVLGLAWENIDLDAGRVRIRQAVQRINGALILKAPKTAKSRRSLPLTPSLVAALKRQRVRQKEARLAAGGRWQESDLVFTTNVGTMIDPRNLIREWHALLRRADVERRPFHTCRHTAASILAREGVPLKVVQEILGHSQLSTTADIYSHLFPEAFAEAAEAMERAFAADA